MWAGPTLANRAVGQLRPTIEQVDSLTVELSDARNISVPLTWYPRLLHGQPEELANWRLIGKGVGLHWDDLDEDISVENLLAGRRSGESKESFKRWLKTRTAVSSSRGPSRRRASR
jgi:hypothetical protein